VTSGTYPWVYRGQTENGEPIFQHATITSVIHVASNTDYGNNSGTTLNSNTSSPYTYCFAPGTQIMTPGGEISVESLTAGSLVTTLDGRQVPVLWIGRQTFALRFQRDTCHLVRFRAGSLGDCLPHSDLTVTGDHGMVLDELVINASALVNDTTITTVPHSELPARLTVYHVETKAHDVILANGAAAETFIDGVTRQAFDNYAEYETLYGAERVIPETTMQRIGAQRLLPDHLHTRLGIAQTGTSIQDVA